MTEAALDLSYEEVPVRRASSPWRSATRRLLRKRLALGALLLIGAFYVVGLFAPVLAPYDYRDQKLEETFAGPSFEHLLGQDSLGRDLLSRVIVSSRTTVIITAATVVTGSLLLAIGLGLASGYLGGPVDTVIMRSGEVIASLPGLPMLILINSTMRPKIEDGVDWLERHASTDAMEAAFRAQSGPEFVFLIVVGCMALVCAACFALWLARGRTGPLIAPVLMLSSAVLILFAMQGVFATPGTEDYFLIFGVLSLFSWVGGARVIRSQVLALRETEYVLAARAMGAGTARVLWSHLLPNVMPIVIVGISAGLGAIALTEIGLSFLGVGVHDPTPSFGQLIFEAQGPRTLTHHLHLLLGPAIVVGLLIFAFNLLGDALNDVLTPKAR